MQTFRVLAGDPGRKGDPFGFCGVEMDYNTGAIYVRFARQYTKTEFADVAKDMQQVIQTVMPDAIVLESNRDGKEAIDEFKKLDDITQGINTVASMSDKNIASNPRSMDKSYTIHWLQDKMKENKIKFPAKDRTSPHMQVLIDQIAMISSYTTPNGSIGYKALRGRHDDIFMAFLLCCHTCRHQYARSEALNGT